MTELTKRSGGRYVVRGGVAQLDTPSTASPSHPDFAARKLEALKSQLERKQSNGDPESELARTREEIAKLEPASAARKSKEARNADSE